MGKRIDYLKLDDTPIVQRIDDLPERGVEDIRDTEWYQFVGRIDD